VLHLPTWELMETTHRQPTCFPLFRRSNFCGPEHEIEPPTKAAVFIWDGLVNLVNIWLQILCKCVRISWMALSDLFGRFVGPVLDRDFLQKSPCLKRDTYPGPWASYIRRPLLVRGHHAAKSMLTTSVFKSFQSQIAASKRFRSFWSPACQPGICF